MKRGFNSDDNIESDRPIKKAAISAEITFIDNAQALVSSSQSEISEKLRLCKPFRICIPKLTNLDIARLTKADDSIPVCEFPAPASPPDCSHSTFESLITGALDTLDNVDNDNLLQHCSTAVDTRKLFDVREGDFLTKLTTIQCRPFSITLPRITESDLKKYNISFKSTAIDAKKTSNNRTVDDTNSSDTVEGEEDLVGERVCFRCLHSYADLVLHLQNCNPDIMVATVEQPLSNAPSCATNSNLIARDIDEDDIITISDDDDLSFVGTSPHCDGLRQSQLNAKCADKTRQQNIDTASLFDNRKTLFEGYHREQVIEVDDPGKDVNFVNGFHITSTKAFDNHFELLEPKETVTALTFDNTILNKICNQKYVSQFDVQGEDVVGRLNVAMPKLVGVKPPMLAHSIKHYDDNEISKFDSENAEKLSHLQLSKSSLPAIGTLFNSIPKTFDNKVSMSTDCSDGNSLEGCRNNEFIAHAVDFSHDSLALNRKSVAKGISFLTSPIRARGAGVSWSNEMYGCPKCPKKFYTPNGLKVHTTRDHYHIVSDADAADNRVCLSANDMFSCSECNAVFNDDVTKFNHECTGYRYKNVSPVDNVLLNQSFPDNSINALLFSQLFQ